VVAGSHPGGEHQGANLRLILLGAPGSGKGTQAAILAKALGIPAISTGEMLRQAVETGSELGLRVQNVMKSGHLVDDETMAEVVKKRLAREDARTGFILDGYPRTLVQADSLFQILAEAGAELGAVVHIEVPEAELVHRALSRKRADDREEVIRRRLNVYREQTEPLVQYYKERSLLQTVDGHATIEAVAAEIEAALKQVA
jgi:adenylate kinase